jgi:hypothetical protein
MKIYEEKSLSEFDFWAGAKNRAKALTSEQFEQLEEILVDLYPDGIEDTSLNDLFWFDSDTVAEWLGFESFEALEQFNSGEDAEEEEAEG